MRVFVSQPPPLALCDLGCLPTPGAVAHGAWLPQHGNFGRFMNGGIAPWGCAHVCVSPRRAPPPLVRYVFFAEWLVNGTLVWCPFWSRSESSSPRASRITAISTSRRKQRPGFASEWQAGRVHVKIPGDGLRVGCGGGGLGGWQAGIIGRSAACSRQSRKKQSPPLKQAQTNQTRTRPGEPPARPGGVRSWPLRA